MIALLLLRVIDFDREQILLRPQEGESLEQTNNITGQGTRLSEANPWDTYSTEMDTQLTPELAAAVAEYAERSYEVGATSSQTKEELHRQQEINDDIAKEYQWLTEEEYADIEQRVGRVMHAAVFINKLREEAHINCWYAAHPHPDKAVLFHDAGNLLPPDNACWVQIGYMPELSIMNFDEHGAPLAERRRGWRTCLLQLILKGIINEDKANEIFGHPKQTEAFNRYNSTLQNFRNNGNRLDA